MVLITVDGLRRDDVGVPFDLGSGVARRRASGGGDGCEEDREGRSETRHAGRGHLLNLSDTLRVGKPSAEQVPPEGESVEPEEHEEKDRHTPERRSNIGHLPQTADKRR